MRKLILIVVISFFCNIDIISQVDPILEDLNDPDIWIREHALSEIRQNDLVEYIPVLSEKVFEQSEPVMIKHFMETLEYLGYEEIGEVAYQFIELSNDFENMFPKADPLEIKVIATEILFNIGDYSTVNYVFDLAEREYPFTQESKPIAVSMLGRIINEVPLFEEDAKDILIQSVINSPNNKIRSLALSIIYEKYGAQNMDLYENVVISDADWSMRAFGFELLHETNYIQLNVLLRGRLVIDIQPELRDWIADYILTWFGEPNDLKFLQDYLPNETDPNASEHISIEISTFIPPKPVGLSLDTMVNNLISYTNEMYQYDWIVDEETTYQYVQNLTAFKEFLSKGQYEDACKKINEEIPTQIEENFVSELITIEAYKFLHYHTIYISERMEELRGPCE